MENLPPGYDLVSDPCQINKIEETQGMKDFNEAREKNKQAILKAFGLPKLIVGKV